MDKNFDLADFNKKFVADKEKRQKESKIKLQEKIDGLNRDANTKKIRLYNLSVSELMIGVKNTWFGILDDLLIMKFNNIATKNDRLFYIGLTIIIVATILHICDFFLED